MIRQVEPDQNKGETQKRVSREAGVESEGQWEVAGRRGSGSLVLRKMLFQPHSEALDSRGKEEVYVYEIVTQGAQSEGLEA